MGQLMERVGAGRTPLAMALASLSEPHLLAGIDRLESALFTLLLLPPALYALLACVYSLGFERSHWQATPGKRVLGLQVVRVDGGAMTLGTAMQRFLAAGLSWISLNLGHALAAFAPYLALHDRLSRTRVLADSPGLPAWAKAWLWAQLARACSPAYGCSRGCKVPCRRRWIARLAGCKCLRPRSRECA